MSGTLKRAWDVMTSEADKPKTFRDFVKIVLPDSVKYERMVYMHISYNFYRGGSLSQHWVVPIKDYIRISDRFRWRGKFFHFGEINGKHSDVRLSWEECVAMVEDDPVAIAEKVEGLRIAGETVFDEAHKQFLNECPEPSSDSEEEDGEEDEEEEDEEGDEEEEIEGK